MAVLEEGKKAPAFSGKDQNGNTVKLSDYAGKVLALYFYPADDTPGCTAQACNLRDNFALLKKNNIAVLGVSPDDAESHKKFEGKYELSFPLIADTDKKIIDKYRVWGEKNMYGKKFMGLLRTTYLINEEGVIIKVFKRPKTKEHSEEIIKAWKEKTGK